MSVTFRGRLVGSVAATLSILVVATSLVHAQTRKHPPSVELALISRDSRATLSGSCRSDRTSPALSARLTVFDEKRHAVTDVDLALTPVLVDGRPTGEFVFRQVLLVPESAFFPGLLSGRISFPEGKGSCECTRAAAYVEDVADAPAHAPYVAQTEPCGCKD